MRSSLIFVLLLVARPARAQCTSPDVVGVAASAVDAVIEDEYEQARLDIQDVLATLECLDHLVDSKSLATLWQARAAMGYFDGDLNTVGSDLRQAVAVDTEFFESRLGRDIRAIWEHEVTQDAGVAKLKVQSGRRRQVLWVDGVACSGQSVEIRPGLHLVQVVEADRLELTRLLDVRDGETASLDLGGNDGIGSAQVLRGVGIGAAGGAALTWATALVWDRQSYQVSTVEEHDRLWFSARRSRAVSMGLASTAVLSWGARRLQSRD